MGLEILEIGAWSLGVGASKLDNGASKSELVLATPELFGWTRPGPRFGALVNLAQRIRCSNISIDR